MEQTARVPIRGPSMRITNALSPSTDSILTCWPSGNRASWPLRSFLLFIEAILPLRSSNDPYQGRLDTVSRKGAHPPPSVEALGVAVTALVGLISDKLKGMDALRPSRLAARATCWRYHGRFPQHDSRKYKQAYQAIHNDLLSDDQGPIKGWGFYGTRRSLTMIRRAL